VRDWSSVHRLLIIGSAGAGKSTLATTLGERLGLPVIHLDSLYWRPGWEETPRQAWTEVVAELCRRDRWIMDGNYGGTLEQRVETCDAVILLDFPRILCLYRVFRRAVRFRGQTRPDLNPGCPEHFPDLEFLRWIWRYPAVSLPKVLAILRADEREKPIVVLRSPAEVRRFLATVRDERPAGGVPRCPASSR
jgi:adenylate kinase family enzyme